jgi:hypothetical protein
VFADQVDLVGDETVRLTVDRVGGLGVRRLDWQKILPACSSTQ